MTNNESSAQGNSGETDLLLYFKNINKKLEIAIKDKDLISIAEELNIYDADKVYTVRDNKIEEVI